MSYNIKTENGRRIIAGNSDQARQIILSDGTDMESAMNSVKSIVGELTSKILDQVSYNENTQYISIDIPEGADMNLAIYNEDTGYLEITTAEGGQ